MSAFSPHLRRFGSLVLVFIMVISLGAAPVAGRPVSAGSQSFIVQGNDVSSVAALVEKYGGKVTSRLDIIHGVGAILSPEALAALKSDPGITRISPNAGVELADNGVGEGKKSPATDYPDVVGADVVWADDVYGSGVTVAVLDTGMGGHSGLERGMDGKKKGRILDWVDFIDGSKKPRDPNGHGTHITGIIANSQKGIDGEWNGVAPGVSIVAVRVLDDIGHGTYEQVIDGIDWVVQNQDQYNIRVMNLSLVSAVASPYWADPLNEAVTRAWAEGITVVVAAGNGGPGPMSVGVPGNNPYVITVGAFTDNYTPYDWSDDFVTPFSAAGPTLDGFVKPDMVAPGAHMVSTMMPWSYLNDNHSSNQITNHYFSMAGTSQAAAVTSGIAALMISVHPELTPTQVKYRLMYSSLPWVSLETNLPLYSIWQQGAGRVNAPDAVFADITGEANQGLDIVADLDSWYDSEGTHYQGYSYYDETAGKFLLHNFPDESGFGGWAGDYIPYTGGFGGWAGGFGGWAGGFGGWAGGFGGWAGGFGGWAGSFGGWAGGYGGWAGGYGGWAGGYGGWAGNVPWSNLEYANAEFVENFLAGVGPDASSAITSVEDWLDEP